MKPANDFYLKVYEVVVQIPQGKVTSYGAISRYLGVESGARMVGYAMNNYRAYNLGYEVPAHRVLNRLGQLTGRGHFEGDTMRERLEQENITFVEEYTVDMEKHFWDPFNLVKD
ncbi:MAG: MGMT family protein [Balneolaceae bacterium]